MHDDLRQRLRELGVVRGVRELATPAPRRHVAIESLVPGRFYTTSHGQCFVAETTYPLDHLHGDLPLSSFLDLPAEIVAQVPQYDALAGVDRRRVCFLDTETTGLSGGTGTMAFVVGLGFFAENAFQVLQYFLRDPGDEPAMIEALAERLPTFEALVSFNGRTFDVPIIENRFILARTPPPTTELPHLDLLHPARRLWHYHLPSCALGTLERAVLGVLREQDDVPSGVIPTLYRDYLRTGDAREMQRVLYHNGIDILSLVTLTARLGRAFADPWAGAEGGETPRLSSGEFFGLGRWYAAEGRTAEAERAYRTALRSFGTAPDEPGPGQAPAADLAPDLRASVLRTLGYLLKRAGRPAEAFACWQQLALESADDVLAHVELAKYFEWHVGDLSLAAGWTRAALAQVETWPAGMRRDTEQAELRHRLARLERKLEKAQIPNPKTQNA
ncbi:MAG TPA: ribonuclease H-like domain-containing protein [Anaerolineae bacterium]|nr:ribonuclease H-like domain-containing protein [Anaerolineae bacterium]